MRTRLSRRQAVLYGTLAVGTLDALDAIESPPPPVLVNALPIHRSGVGLPSVPFARAAAR